MKWSKFKPYLFIYYYFFFRPEGNFVILVKIRGIHKTSDRHDVGSWSEGWRWLEAVGFGNGQPAVVSRVLWKRHVANFSWFKTQFAWKFICSPIFLLTVNFQIHTNEIGVLWQKNNEQINKLSSPLPPLFSKYALVGFFACKDL